MTQPLFPSTIGRQSRSVKFLTITTVVRKTTVRPGPGAWTRRCFRKGGGVPPPLARATLKNDTSCCSDVGRQSKGSRGAGGDCTTKLYHSITL